MIMVFGSIHITVSVVAARQPLPGERVDGGERQIRPGGRGTAVALAAQRFGVQTQMVGAVGDDAFADHALDRLRLAGTDLRRVRHLAGQATGLSCVTALAGALPATVTAPGANEAVRAHWIGDDELGACRSLLVDPALPAGPALALARRARQCGCRTLLLAAPWPRQVVPPGLFDWVIIDAAGLRQVSNDALLPPPAPPTDWSAPAQRLAALLDCRLALYLAEAGAWTVDAGGVRQRRNGWRAPIRDPATAFDTFAGVFAAALNQGLTEPRAADHAIAAAALLDTRHGPPATPPDRSTIEDALLREAVASR